MATLQRPELPQARRQLFWGEDTVHVAQCVLLCSVGGKDYKCIDKMLIPLLLHTELFVTQRFVICQYSFVLTYSTLPFLAGQEK